VDGNKVIHRRRDGQGATRKYYLKRDGSLALAVEIAPNVVEFGRLVAVPDRTPPDHYEDALWVARKALKTGLAAGEVDEALAIFEAALDAAFGVLREALREALQS
jgi:hypothetical protein